MAHERAGKSRKIGRGITPEKLRAALMAHFARTPDEVIVMRVEKLIDESIVAFMSMQTPKARVGMRAAFNSTPKQLGKAAVAVARRRKRT